MRLGFNRIMASINIHLKTEQYSKMFFGSAGVAGGASATTAGGAAPAATATKEAPKEKPAKKEKAPEGGKGAAPAAEEEDKLVLQNAEHGKVVTRFPPEASGFIHIGHAKAALVNSMLRTKYGGKMIFRFDDTNPEKENTEFEQAIIEDLGRLGVTWDVGPTYSSDYFDLMIEKCEWMLKNDLAYCDITDPEEMKKYRYDGVATPSRSHSVEENLRIWDEMKRGTPFGQTACVRAKISIDNANKALRDPTMYRTKVQAHPRTGTKYNVYPTYDFCVPIVDSVEGVTHALRTNEYHDRNAQYDWFIDALKLRRPLLEDFSRLNMEYSLMSKRKLTKCVETGVVDGWDDPRFPTVRALLRRGLKVDALKEFVKVQGMSKAVNFMEWSKLWNFNVQILDPSVPRYSAVSADHSVVCTVTNGPADITAQTRPRHKKNEALGIKTYFQGPVILLDAEDVALLAEGEEVTLMDWGNAFVKNIVSEGGYPVRAIIELNPTGDIKKTKYKLTWVAQNPSANVRLLLCEYDQLLTKKKPDPEDELEAILAKNTLFKQNAFGEPAMAELKVGDTFQIERRGYYILDKILKDNTLSLIAIPDGKDKLNHLSAKAQFYKENPALAPAAPAATAEAAGAKPAAKAGKSEDSQTLEEKKAAKAAKKAASAGKK